MKAKRLRSVSVWAAVKVRRDGLTVPEAAKIFSATHHNMYGVLARMYFAGLIARRSDADGEYVYYTNSGSRPPESKPRGQHWREKKQVSLNVARGSMHEVLFSSSMPGVLNRYLCTPVVRV